MQHLSQGSSEPGGRDEAPANPGGTDGAPHEVPADTSRLDAATTEVENPLIRRVVWAASALYAVTLTAITWVRYEAFLAEGDLAVFTQFAWQFGHLDEPFSSLTMRPMLADHWEPAIALLAPLGALGITAPGLLAVQATVSAAIAPLLLTLARRFGARGWLAAVVPLLWLVSPVAARANLWDFHPDVIIAATLVVAVLAAISDRPWLFWGMVILGCSLKEDAGLTFAALGLVLAFRGDRRRGLTLAAVAGLWAVLLNGVLLPILGPSTREHYTDRFVGDRADSFSGVIAYWVTHPGDTLTELVTWDKVALLALVVVVATAGLAVCAPRWLIAAIPLAALNLLSAYDGPHGLRYQYWLVPGAVVAIAGAAGAARVRRGFRAPVLVSALACGVFLAALSGVAIVQLAGEIRSAWELRDDRKRIVRAIPAGAAVSVPQPFLAQLAERNKIFAYPVPLLEEVPISEVGPERVARERAELEYIVFDPTVSRFQDTIERAVALGFRPVLTSGTTTLYRRSP